MSQRERGSLRQQTLFRYAVPTVGGSAYLHERGGNTAEAASLLAANNNISPQHSVSWGDYHMSGRKVETSGTFRVLSHNVNGLSTIDNNVGVRNFAAAIQEKAVSLFGIQETNRNFERPIMVRSFHDVLRGVSTQHKGVVSSAKIQWPTNYQPGGTAVSVRNQWATRFLEKGSDDMGRWSWLTLAGRGNLKITCISGYRVCNGAAETSVTARTSRSQQEWMQADRGLAPVNLRDNFISDLAILIAALKVKGHDIILMMDANESSGQGSGVDRLMMKCGLVDAHTLSSDPSPPPATYQRGSKKIDFILITPSIVPAVRAVSVLPLHDGYLSDHRALVVDFNAAILFAGKTSPVLSPTGRNLTSTNPEALHLYIVHLCKHIEVHGLVEKVAALQSKSESGVWTTAQVEEWETIDNLLEQGRAASETKCPSRRSGLFPWSPELGRAGKRLLYWNLRVREFTSRNTNLDLLDKLAAEVNISVEEQEWHPAETVRKNCRQAKKALQEVKKDAAALRIEHMEATAKLSASLHNWSEESAVAAIAAREKSSKQFRQLRGIFNKGMSAGFDRLDIPDSFAVLREGEEVPRIPLVVKEAIEAVLLPHTEKRFRQHQETPFGNGSRKSSLGYDCTSKDVDELLEGSYDRELEHLSEEARTWLTHLKSRDFVNAGGVISDNISLNDWVSGWSKMRESTASAPGAGHYGHYKAAAAAARLPEDHPDHTTAIAQIYAIMCSLPLRHGFAPKRWRSCVDAIIEKIPGQPRIEKLRIIMLYEADFNFVLKLIFGKRLVRFAESHKCLGNSNHGSRPGRQTFDALLEKLMVYEIARLSRTSVITVDNDAKSCYDRIIKTLSMVACMGVGLPRSVAVMHNKTHHGMEHRIKSGHGMFRPYSGTDDDELEGTGQGSGGSPAIWLIYNACLLEAYQRFTTGIHLPSPFEDLVVQILAIFYVDDGMPGVNDALKPEAESLAVLLQQAQDASQSWERLLFVSGGALELTKCFTYIVYWEFFENGEHRLIEPGEIPNCTQVDDHFSGPISLTYGDKSDARHRIATESPYKGRRTLGVRIAPAGNWDDEFKFRSEQSRELALLLACAEVSHETAAVAYRSMIIPKLEYPLTVTQFSQKECDRIMSPVLRVCLSKMGYNPNMPREVVYGPTTMGGLGFHDYFVEQGIAHVTMLVGHLRQGSETARMLKMELQWCQAQAGTTIHLLESPHVAIEYIESCWIMSLRSFLSTYDLHIDLTEIRKPMPLCRGDEFIMDAFRTRGVCTVTELQRLNACRMYLQVARLSEISTADGVHLLEDPLKGWDHDLSYFGSLDRWPRQGRPPKQWWTLWRKKLKFVFSSDGTSTRLRYRLGEWFYEPMQSGEWNVLVSTQLTRNEVYVLREDGNYDVHLQRDDDSRSGRMEVCARSLTVVDSVPWCALPASLGTKNKMGNCKVLHRGAVYQTADISIDPPQSLAEYVSQQPAHIQQLLCHCDLTDATARAVSDLAYSGAKLDSGTDGGLLNGLGTFGFVWGDPATDNILARGKGVVEGISSFMSSTRTELCGIFASLTYLRLVIEYHQVVLPRCGLSCTIYCDSQAALKRVDNLSYDGFGTTWRCRENYDLEAAIRQCLQQRAVRANWRWIRGHANKRKERHEFNRAEVLNDEADVLATAARDEYTGGTISDGHWPEQVVSVVGPNGRLCGKLRSSIRFCCTAPDMVSYWKDRYGWSKPQAELVDTIAIRASSAKLRGGAARRLQKLRCGWLPTNSRESRCNPDKLSACAACSTPATEVEETVDHLFQCTGRSRRQAVCDRFSTLHNDFREWKTSKLIITAIRAGALAWIEGKDPPTLESLKLPDTVLGRLTAKAYQEQTLLGWNVLFRGLWATSWRQAQEYQFTCYHSRDKQDVSDRWAGKAQTWFISLFELLWGLRNEDEYGVDHETQLLVRLATCERAVRRLFLKGADLPYRERHPFRTPMEELLQKTVHDQELWIKKTEDYLPKAFRRLRKCQETNQLAITDFFVRL